MARSENEGETRSRGTDAPVRKQESAGQAVTRSESRAVQQSNGTSDAIGKSEVRTEAKNWNAGTTATEGDTVGEGAPRMIGSSKGGASGTSGSAANSEGGVLTTSEGDSESSNWSESDAENEGISISLQYVPLPMTEVEYHDSGRLLRPVSDQIAKKQQEMMMLRRQHRLVSLSYLDFTFIMCVAHVGDAFDDLPELRTGRGGRS